jgi:hypothetical protein
MTSREKAFRGLRNMKNIIKMQIMSRGMNYRMTNVMYIHTLPASCVNLFIAIIAVSHVQLLQFACVL